MREKEVLDIIKIYGISKNKRIKKIEKKDEIELLSVEKNLNNFKGNFEKKFRMGKVNYIKISIENGTYKVNTRDLSNALIKHMGDMKKEVIELEEIVGKLKYIEGK